MSETIIWVSESDLCEFCDAILDHFGQCPNGCDLIESADWDDEDDWYPGWGSDWDVPEEEKGKP
jgi:hypothetical protein